MPNANGTAIGLNLGSSTITYYRNNTSFSTAQVANVAGSTGGTWPQPGGFSGGSSDLFAIVIYNTALSAADATFLEYSLNQAYSLPLAPKALVALQGDSITEGVVGGNWNYNKSLIPYLGNEVAVYNYGHSGELLAGMTAGPTAPQISGVPSIAICFGGVNDGTPAATLESNATTWATNTRASGYTKLGFATLFPRRGGDTADVLAFNNWIRQNSGPGLLFDFDVDVWQEPSFLPSWSTTDSPDNLHPTQPAYEKIAPIIAEQIANQLSGLVP